MLVHIVYLVFSVVMTAIQQQLRGVAQVTDRSDKPVPLKQELRPLIVVDTFVDVFQDFDQLGFRFPTVTVQQLAVQEDRADGAGPIEVQHRRLIGVVVPKANTNNLVSVFLVVELMQKPDMQLLYFLAELGQNQDTVAHLLVLRNSENIGTDLTLPVQVALHSQMTLHSQVALHFKLPQNIIMINQQYLSLRHVHEGLNGLVNLSGLLNQHVKPSIVI